MTDTRRETGAAKRPGRSESRRFDTWANCTNVYYSGLLRALGKTGPRSGAGWSNVVIPGRQGATFPEWRPGWSKLDHPDGQMATSHKWPSDPPTGAPGALMGTRL